MKIYLLGLATIPALAAALWVIRELAIEVWSLWQHWHPRAVLDNRFSRARWIATAIASDVAPISYRGFGWRVIVFRGVYSKGCPVEVFDEIQRGVEKAQNRWEERDSA